MKQVINRRVAARFREQYSVMSRSQLRMLGVSSDAEARKVSAGEWERPTRRTVRLAGSTPSPEQDLMIALLETGPAAVASHQSAAWLWRFADAPNRHSVTIGIGAEARPGPFTIHRLARPPERTSTVRHISCTDPLRTLVDLAGVVAPEQIDDALDRAVAARLVTVEAVKAEMARLSRKGRKGTGAMAAALRRRGLVEGPHPSVLEARLHRLLRMGGITPVGVEVVAGSEGQYRIDATLDPLVALEVDGHRFHSTAEQKSYDERRRHEIRMGGVFLLVFDWTDVTRDGRRVLAECHQALARYGSGSAGRLTGT